MKTGSLLSISAIFSIVLGTALAANPWNDPNLVSMFDGINLTNWTASKADEWIAANGTIHGTGKDRGWIYYKEKVGTFRWIFNVRQIVGNHQPTVLIWGTTTPLKDALSAIQFQPPNGGHWDYREGHNNGGDSLFKQVNHTKFDIHNWSQCEIIANHETGIARMACCKINEESMKPTIETCKAIEVLQFQDKSAGRVGPLALQVHNAGIEDEYRYLYLESPVKNIDKFITV